MIAPAKILVVKQGAAYDMSQLVSMVRWSGRRGSAARRLEVTFIDDDGQGRDRAGLNVENGDSVVFYWKNEELFRGMFVMQNQSRRRTLNAKAYDVGIRLANNFDTFCYSNKTASEIFRDVCSRFGIPIGQVADTRYVISELPKPMTTAWDVITDALAITYAAVGVRYFPVVQREVVSLIERRLNILQWVIETGVNLIDYTQVKTIEHIKTRIVLLSSEGDVLATAENAELKQRLGTFQLIKRVDDDMNAGQLSQLVNTTLAENNQDTQRLTITAKGLPEVITGRGVFIAVKPLDVSRSYYVEQDIHTFDRQAHTMDLELVPAADAGEV